ncbi:hypothetical protein AB0F81_33795 [Actinoplanes sp. NPDC024001]|uniref:hypothetical protein n=1 Tax=Actinoplanes sp. NPDC024001 TaxID=3154598 RepID=UPI0033DE7C1F
MHDETPDPAVHVTRRLGKSPQERGSLGNGTCPDIFELSDGRFAVIGTDMTGDLELPADAGCASYERVVVITRETLTSARRDIPTH